VARENEKLDEQKKKRRLKEGRKGSPFYGAPGRRKESISRQMALDERFIDYETRIKNVS